MRCAGRALSAAPTLVAATRQHCRGVCALSFSCFSSRLLEVSLYSSSASRAEWQAAEKHRHTPQGEGALGKVACVGVCVGAVHVPKQMTNTMCTTQPDTCRWGNEYQVGKNGSCAFVSLLLFSYLGETATCLCVRVCLTSSFSSRRSAASSLMMQPPHFLACCFPAPFLPRTFPSPTLCAYRP